MNQTQITNALQKIPLFSGLNATQTTAIGAHVTERKLGRDEQLFQAGDAADRFFLLLEGQVKLYFNTADGHEKVIEIIRPGMTFGEAVMLIEQPFPAHARAVTPSTLLTFPRSTINQLLHDDADAALRMLASLSRRMHGMVQVIEELTTYSSTQRVIGYLIGERSAPDAMSLTLPAGKALIASKLNLTPETFSRVLRELQQAGLIAVDGREIKLLESAGLLQFGQSGAGKP